MTNNNIVQKLWNLCDVLRDDGINYNKLTEKLTKDTHPPKHL
jgi:type I restriction enzyme M protein